MGEAFRISVIAIMAALMVTLLVAFIRLANSAATGKRYEYSEAEMAQGIHCTDLFSGASSPLNAALDGRLGAQIDDRVSLAIDDFQLGPLEQDGTHELTVLYRIMRIGEVVPPAKKATGTVTNTDCTFQLKVFQR
jgi:hypothetical protein